MRSQAERDEIQRPSHRGVDLQLHGLPIPANPAVPDSASNSDPAIDSVIAGTGGRRRTNNPPTTTERDDNFAIVTDDNGTAHVVRKPDSTVRSAVPTPEQIGDGIAAWSKVDKFTDQDYVTLSGDKIFEQNGVHVIPFEGSLSFLIPVIGGNFDIAQAIQRGLGEDPYRARRQNMLDASRDERAADIARKRNAALADTRRMMTRNLERVWALAEPGERKRVVFEMWDECAETGDPETVAAGDEARRTIVELVRSHGLVFTSRELADFNAHRRSRAAFQP